MTTPGRRRLLAGGAISIAVAGAAGGAVLAGHSAAPDARLSVATAADPTASPSPSAGGQAPARRPAQALRRLGAGGVIGKVTAVSGSSLTLVDAKGASHTLSLGPDVRVSGPDGREQATAIPQGELVIVVTRHPRTPGAASPSPAASSSGAAAGTVVVAIRDTGFKAA